MALASSHSAESPSNAKELGCRHDACINVVDDVMKLTSNKNHALFVTWPSMHYIGLTYWCLRGQLAVYSAPMFIVDDSIIYEFRLDLREVREYYFTDNDRCWYNGWNDTVVQSVSPDVSTVFHVLRLQCSFSPDSSFWLAYIDTLIVMR